jgi:hypothetical protein
MTAYAELNGLRVTRATVEIPFYGTWTADVQLASDAAIPDAAVLTIGDLVLKGTRYRTQAFAGVRSSRLVGGAGGWLSQVAAQPYYNPTGLFLSLLLGDLAALTGETVAIAADVSVGPYFVREAAPAQRILRQLVGNNWWLDSNGVTQVGASRDSSAISSAFILADYHSEEGRAVAATEHLSDWMPGRTFTGGTVPGSPVISSVRHILTDQLRTEVLIQQPLDRFYSPFQQLTRETDPGRTFANLYEYSVDSSTSATANLKATDPSLPIPQRLIGVPLRVGLPGFTVTPDAGSVVLVAFANGNPARPVIIAYDSTGATLKANGGARPVVCYGDVAALPAGFGITANGFPVVGTLTQGITDPIALARRLNG